LRRDDAKDVPENDRSDLEDRDRGGVLEDRVLAFLDLIEERGQVPAPRERVT
jgi:hypothetical protein